jgi:hypothetical protein
MKDHEKRELVSRLTAVAKEYHYSEQLRARIADVVLPALESLERYWAHEGGAVVAQVLQSLAPRDQRDIDWGAVDEELRTILYTNTNCYISPEAMGKLRQLLRTVSRQ